MFIIEQWFWFGFDQILIDAVNMFQMISRLVLSSICKETHKYAVSQFCVIFNYESAIPKRKSDKIEQVFRFLFQALS